MFKKVMEKIQYEDNKIDFWLNACANQSPSELMSKPSNRKFLNSTQHLSGLYYRESKDIDTSKTKKTKQKIDDFCSLNLEMA